MHRTEYPQGKENKLELIGGEDIYAKDLCGWSMKQEDLLMVQHLPPFFASTQSTSYLIMKGLLRPWGHYGKQPELVSTTVVQF